jgi:hypothetical protein
LTPGPPPGAPARVRRCRPSTGRPATGPGTGTFAEVGIVIGV